MNLNKYMFAGRLVKPIELRQMPNGTKVATLDVATNRKYTNKNTGEKVETTTWLRLTAFGKTAELANQYLVKGQEIYAECRIDNRNWEKDGVKHYDFSWIIESLQFGSKPQGAQGNNSAPVQNTAPVNNDSSNDWPDVTGAEEDINVEDIPF